MTDTHQRLIWPRITKRYLTTERASLGEKKKAIIMKLLARESNVSIILLDEIKAGQEQ